MKQNDRTPYTYRVTHIPTGYHYYGVRYAKGCHPSDFWSDYFTSSKRVHRLIRDTGLDSFRIEIRKIFDNTENAREWEHRVNTRVMNWPNYLNMHNNKAFSEIINSKAGKIGSQIVKDSGLFQSEKWRKASSRADDIWFTDGKRNRRVHKDKIEEFRRMHPDWREGIVRENMQIPENRGRIYLYSPDKKIKRFVHMGTQIYDDLIAAGYKRNESTVMWEERWKDQTKPRLRQRRKIRNKRNCFTIPLF